MGEIIRTTVRAVLATVGALVLAGLACARGPEPTAVRAASPYDVLDRQGVIYKRWTPALPAKVALGTIHERDCALRDAVIIYRGSTGLDYGAPLPVATTWAINLKFLEELIQESARTILGTKVVRLEHFGAYSCRSIHQLPETASQHAFGNAFDLAAFVTESGRRISVVNDYPTSANAAPSRPGLFLRQIEQSLRDRSDLFPTVLSPLFDQRHRDHFHIEGPRPTPRL